MPRIDPIQLLKCLSVLLSPTGGIKSKDELQRLVRLMTKFSKKLVSKCIYIQVLKCTETELLGVFMGSGGWRLVHMWLTESIVAKNWPLVQELLELLLLCPVDIERLKTNNCPKLVKELSKDGNHIAIRSLASKLVEQWLKTVKGDNVEPISILDIPQIISEASLQNQCLESSHIQSETNNLEKNENQVELKDTDINNVISQNDISPDCVKVEDEIMNETITIKDEPKEQETLPVLKISLRDGKQIISQVEENECKTTKKSDHSKTKSKESLSDKSLKPDSKSSSKSSSSDKHRSSSSSSSNKKSSSSSSSSSSRHHSKDKSRDKDRRSSHSSSSSSSKSSRHSESSKKSSSSNSKSKEDKNNKGVSENKEKDDKQTTTTTSKVGKDEKIVDKPSIQKLGKIPKLSDRKEKPSISIEVRKPDEPKPKTVKMFNSKFRKHGLEEEIKPPPSRATLLSKKVLPALPPTVPTPKRPSPVHNETPPEKKAKLIEPVEKPGAIKLIPPKHKPMVLQESDMFMDALNASATNKKEPKKRKRRTSGSRDGNAPNESSPPHTPTSPTENKSVPPKFYQDTLDADEDKEKTIDKESKETSKSQPEEPAKNPEPHTLTVNGIKGVLCYHRRKGPKKSIKWKPDSELEEIQYFELDETERINVTKTFTDMKHLERIHEREAFQKARNLINDDIMEEKTMWRPLVQIETEGQIVVEYGKNSKEREIQAIRQKGTLQPLYFHKSMIPDSPFEAEPETHLYSEPTIIPLDDITGNQDNISDFRNMPWPEPKGNAPASTATTINVPTMFPTNVPPFANAFPNPQFPGIPPGFQAPNMIPPEWPNGVPPIMPGGMPVLGPMANIPPGAMPPAMMVPPGPDMFGAPAGMFPGPPEGFEMMDNMMGPNMFPPDFNMAQGPPGVDSFPGGFRGSMRGRGASAGGHWRGKGAAAWGRGGGGPRPGGRKACIYFQRKGSCRQGDNCSFLHPGVNCPF